MGECSVRFNSQCRTFISVCNQPPRSTQPSVLPESVNEDQLRQARQSMDHSVSGWTRGVPVKLWDLLRTRAIPERLRDVFKTRRYTNPRLPSLTLPLRSRRTVFFSCLYNRKRGYRCGTGHTRKWLSRKVDKRTCCERNSASSALELSNRSTRNRRSASTNAAPSTRRASSWKSWPRPDDRDSMRPKWENSTSWGLSSTFYDLFSIIDCETSRTRGHNFRIFKEHSNINCRLNSVVCRNINVWNSLPAHIVDSDRVAVFKRRLSSMNMSCS